MPPRLSVTLSEGKPYSLPSRWEWCPLKKRRGKTGPPDRTCCSRLCREGAGNPEEGAGRAGGERGGCGARTCALRGCSSGNCRGGSEGRPQPLSWLPVLPPAHQGKERAQRAPRGMQGRGPACSRALPCDFPPRLSSACEARASVGESRERASTQ